MIIYGTMDDDVLTGGADGDQLFGIDGGDTLKGGDGADTLGGGEGRDRLEGGAGIDTANFDDIYAVTVDLAAGTARSGSTVDRLISIENAAGSIFDDTLLGDGEDNIFEPRGGFDQIKGRGGFDIVDLRTSDMYRSTIRLSVTSRQDFIGGSIKLSGVEGLIGTAFEDTLTGTRGANLLDGSGGSDTLDGGKGDDTLRGSAGPDILVGAAGKDLIDGGDGNDLVQIKNWSDSRGDVIDGGSGTDRLQIDPAPHGKADLRSLAFSNIEYLSAAGIDVAMSATQFRNFNVLYADTITITDPGTFVIKFEVDSDTLYAAVIARVDLANGKNTFDMRALSLDYERNEIGEVHGGKDEDTIIGSIDNDRLYGEAGRDKLYGGDGDDTLNGGTGADLMKGGAGDDFYRVDSTMDVIKDTGGQDTVKVSIDYRLGSGLENLILARAATVHGNDRSNEITGSAGKDTIYGEGGDDTIAGGGGNDTIYGGAGTDNIDGGSGNDVIHSSGTDIVGGKGYDILYWGGYNLYADDSVEEIHQTGSDGTVSGGMSDNLLIGATNGINHLFGQGGNDTIVGGAKADEIGGNYGDDLLTGGTGADTFYFDEFSTTVVDEITDYNSDEGDILNFTALEDAAIQAGITSISYLGTGAFSGHAGEARIDLHSGYGLFMFDLNGDRQSDLTIKLDGVTASTTIAYLL